MGEVSRAADGARREVAIKILPTHLTAGPDRRARFARDSRLLGTLNRPRTGTIVVPTRCSGS